MAGGGVVSDVCLALHRRCWSFDLLDRKDKRPEIEVYQWKTKNLKWPALNDNYNYPPTTIINAHKKIDHFCIHHKY